MSQVAQVAQVAQVQLTLAQIQAILAKASLVYVEKSDIETGLKFIETTAKLQVFYDKLVAKSQILQVKAELKAEKQKSNFLLNTFIEKPELRDVLKEQFEKTQRYIKMYQNTLDRIEATLYNVPVSLIVEF